MDLNEVYRLELKRAEEQAEQRQRAFEESTRRADHRFLEQLKRRR